MPRLKGEYLKAGFDSRLRLEFHGSKVTSDAGFPAYHDPYGKYRVQELKIKWNRNSWLHGKVSS